jgi:hypothetical protein
MNFISRLSNSAGLRFALVFVSVVVAAACFVVYFGLTALTAYERSVLALKLTWLAGAWLAAPIGIGALVGFLAWRWDAALITGGLVFLGVFLLKINEPHPHQHHEELIAQCRRDAPDRVWGCLMSYGPDGRAALDYLRSK